MNPPQSPCNASGNFCWTNPSDLHFCVHGGPSFTPLNEAPAMERNSMPAERVHHHHHHHHKHELTLAKDKKFKKFFVLSILAVLCSSVGWSMMYRLNWDIGEIVYPSSIYPYWYQSVFSTVLFVIIFIILLCITYKVFKKLGKSPESLFYW
jgi:hypothetical protein